MAEAVTIAAKYVFLDVVEYSRGRSVEAQTEIIEVLNKVVRSAVQATNISTDNIIFIPTGDGICIATLGIQQPYDLHVLMGLHLLSLIDEHNQNSADPQRRFHVRIGINENDDNQVIDINGQRNVAGAGINSAQRIMSAAGPSNLFLSESVYDRISQREKYMGHFVKHVTTAKHQVDLAVYQYVNPEAKGLSSTPPLEFASQDLPEPPLDEFTAYYFANLVKHADFIKDKMSTLNEYAIGVLVWFLAKDCTSRASTTGVDRPSVTLTEDQTLEEHLEKIALSHFLTVAHFALQIRRQITSQFYKYLIGKNCLAVSIDGIKKIQMEWPSIAKEFGLL